MHKIPYHTLGSFSYKFKAHRWVRVRAVTAAFAMLTGSLHVEMTGRLDWRGINLGRGGRGWICDSGYGG